MDERNLPGRLDESDGHVVPIRLSGETDTDQLAEEQDRAAQSEQIEGIGQISRDHSV